VKGCAGRVEGLGHLEACPYEPVWYDVGAEQRDDRQVLVVVPGERFCYYHAHVAAGLIVDSVWDPRVAAGPGEPPDLLLHLLASIE
jgi:hypothetical protein